MTQAYQHQLRKDEAIVEQETECFPDIALRMAERAGRFSAIAYRYAGYADFEAAERQRILRDPTSLVAAYVAERNIDGEPEEIVADLLDAIRATLYGGGFSVERGYIEEAAANLRCTVEMRQQRREEDLDAAAAARSDEAYDRKVDAGLIGRCDFLPAKV